MRRNLIDEQTMNTHEFLFADVTLVARASGALYWPDQQLLVISDLHLGKSERIARLGGAMLPPYETTDTLARLDGEITACDPKTVICLGDSFDDLHASTGLAEDVLRWLSRLMAGRRWIWIEGNHDPGPVALAGSHLAEITVGALAFRHIAQTNGTGEISGHFHPKAALRTRGRTVSRPCFLYDSDRVILPAFGTYTGGLRSSSPVLLALMRQNAMAVLTGKTAHAIPMPRAG